jgi:hypothetical protein
LAYVYRHIRTDKNQPFYIGVGLRDNGYKRAYQRCKDKRSEHWRNIAKNGYEVEILLDDLTDDQAFQKEIEFIALYGRSDIGTGILCNKTDGGDRPSPRYGDDNPAKRPEVKEKLAKARTGFVVTEATRKKLSEAARSRGSVPPRPNGLNRKKIFQRTLDGDLVAEWSWGGEAAMSGNGWSRNEIAKAACGIKSKAYGFRWSYE